MAVVLTLGAENVSELWVIGKKTVAIMHLGVQCEREKELLPMQEGPGATAFTTKQLASRVTAKRTHQKQEVNRFVICKSVHQLIASMQMINKISFD